MLTPARSRCRWVAFGDRLLLLVRDRLPRGYLGGWGQAALGRSRCGLGWEGKWGQAAVRGLGEFSVGLRGTVPALAGRLGGGVAFALCARGWGVRLQRSLRHDPAAAGSLLGTGYLGGWGLLKLGTGYSSPVPLRLGEGS